MKSKPAERLIAIWHRNEAIKMIQQMATYFESFTNALLNLSKYQ